MMTSSDALQNADRRPAVRWLILGIFVSTVVVFSTAPVRNQARKIRQGENGSKDYPLWYETGFLELHGASPYYLNNGENVRRVNRFLADPSRPLALSDDATGEFPFMYPPGAAGLLAILASAGKWPTVLFLVGLNSVAWVTCVLAPVYLLTGRVRGAPTLLYWVPSLVCCVYIWDTYLEGQLAFCLSACLLGMFVCLRQNRPVAAGGLFALAAGFKAFPILALPYLIYRRQWKTIVWAAGFLIVLLFALPACFRGVGGAVDDLKVWKAGMLTPNTPAVIGQRAARSYTWQNGSVLAVAHRWLRPVVADHDDKVPPITVNVADLPFRAINYIADGLIVALGFGYVAVTSTRRPRDPFGTTAEQAMLLILIVICTPLSFTYNTTWTMCAITTVLWHVTRSDRTPRQRTVYLAWLIASWVPLIFSIGNPHFRHVRAMGNTLASEMILLAEIAWLLFVTPVDRPSAKTNSV